MHFTCQIAFTMGLVSVASSAFSQPCEQEGREIEILPEISVKIPSSLPSVPPDDGLIQRLREDSQSDLLQNLGKDASQAGAGTMATGRRKILAFHDSYVTNRGESRIIFAYNCALQCLPGFQPQTIVITDERYRLIAWKEIGGNTVVEAVDLLTDDARGRVLVITRRHRGNVSYPPQGKYRVGLADDVIQELPEVEWIYASEAERQEYERIRQLLHDRQKKSGKQPSKKSSRPARPTEDTR